MKCCMGRGDAGREINFTMKETKVAKFDEVFAEGAAALESAENFRSGIQDSKSTILTLSGAYTLKDGSLADGITTWAWSCGAQIGTEKIANNFKPKIEMDGDKPTFSCEIDPCCDDDNKEICETLQLYIETVAGAATSIQLITDQLQAVSTKASELAGTAKDDISGAGLGIKDGMMAMSALTANTKTLSTGLSKLGALGPVAQEAIADLKEVSTKLAGILADASKNAQEGLGKGAKTAVEMAAKQHPSKKLPEADLKKNSDKIAHDKRKASGAKKTDAKPADAAEANKNEEEKCTKTEEGAAKLDDVKTEIVAEADAPAGVEA